MKNRMAVLLLAVAALVAVPALGANLTVTNAAAMGSSGAQSDCAVALNPDGTDATTADNETGPCGLEVNMDGTNKRAFVTDTTPADETVYRASFYWDPNDLKTAGTPLPNGGQLVLLRARTDAFAGTFQVMTRSTSNRGFRLWIRALSNNGNPKFTARVDLGCPGCVVPPVTLPVEIQAEWTQGDVCNAPSGSAVISVFDASGVLIGTSTLINQSGASVGINNCSREVDVVDMGMVNVFGAFFPSGNSMYLDEFSSFRTLAP